MGEFPSKENQFKKGKSGNPLGPKPGYRHMKTILREIMKGSIEYKDMSGNKTTMNVDQALMIAQVSKAVYKRDTNAAKFVVEEMEGLKTQRIEADNINTNVNHNFSGAAVEKDMDDFALERVKKMKQDDGKE